MEEDEEKEGDDDNIIIHSFVEYGAFDDTAMGKAEEEVATEDEPVDDLWSGHPWCTEKMRKWKGEDQVRAYARGSQEIAIPNLWCGTEKLGTTLEVLQWKTKNGVSDKRFGELLKIQKKMLLKDNELPVTMYEAK